MCALDRVYIWYMNRGRRTKINGGAVCRCRLYVLNPPLYSTSDFEHPSLLSLLSMTETPTITVDLNTLDLPIGLSNESKG